MKKKSRVVLVVIGFLVLGVLAFGGGRFAWRTLRALHGVHD